MKVTVDRTEEFKTAISSLRTDAVLIGIPVANGPRGQDDQHEVEGGAVMNNAAILAINEFGSEEAHIPPRPVMKLGIGAAKDAIAAEFKKAAQNVLSKGMSALEQYYERAGIIASNSVKKQINSQEGIEAPAESTLAARKAVGFKGVKALIVSGQLRNAITYVVNRGGL
jgi:hypothetical protein